MPRNTGTASVACLLINGFPIKAERQRFPVLRSKPLILAESRGSGSVVLHSSPEATGVTPGMPLKKALLHCPEAHTLPAHDEFYSDVFAGIVDSLEARYTAVEPGGMGCMYINLEGLSSQFCGEARLVASLLQAVPEIFDPRVGVASGCLPTYLAALSAGAGRALQVSPEDVSILRNYPLDLLPIHPESNLRLKSMAVRNLGDLVSMPASAVLANLSTEDRRSSELARILQIRQSPRVSLEAA